MMREPEQRDAFVFGIVVTMAKLFSDFYFPNSTERQNNESSTEPYLASFMPLSMAFLLLVMLLKLLETVWRVVENLQRISWLITGNARFLGGSGQDFFAQAQTQNMGQATHSHTSTAPADSHHQTILEKKGIRLEDLPPEFMCSLRNEVMDIPVFDPRYPEVMYEQKNILHWLAIKPINPFTRASLMPSDLIVAEELKKEIEMYVTRYLQKDNVILAPTEPATSQDNYCGFSHGFLRR